MNKKPPKLTEKPRFAAKSRPQGWMIGLSVGALSLSGLCLLATVAGMMLSFDRVGSASSPVAPSDLASGISIALIPSVIAAPLALLGIVLFILAVLRRQPAAGT